MSTISPNALAATTALSGYRMNFGVAQTLLTGAFLLLTGSATVGSPGVLTNLCAFPALSPPPGSVSGAPTIATNDFTINTGGTDYATTPLADNGGDYTIFVAIKNTAATPGFVAVSTYGTDPSNGISTALKGDQLAATSATNLRFKGYYYPPASTTPNAATINLTINNLATTAHCYCIQRHVAGGNITWTIYDLTTSGVTSPQTITETGTVANNVSNTWTIGATPGGGAGAATAQLPLVMVWQSAANGGAAFAANYVAMVYAKLQTLVANLLPSPPFTI